MIELATIAKVKELHSSWTSSSAMDAVLTRLVKSASFAIQRYLGVDFKLTARTELHDVFPGEVDFDLKSYPVSTSPAPVVKNSTVGDFSGISAMDSDNYAVDYSRGRLLFRAGIVPLWGPQAIQIVYTAGIGANAAAVEAHADYADLVEATCQQVLDWYTNRRSPGAKAKTVGGASTTSEWDPMASQLSSRVKDMLAPFVRHGC